MRELSFESHLRLVESELNNLPHPNRWAFGGWLAECMHLGYMDFVTESGTIDKLGEIISFIWKCIVNDTIDNQIIASSMKSLRTMSFDEFSSSKYWIDADQAVGCCYQILLALMNDPVKHLVMAADQVLECGFERLFAETNDASLSVDEMRIELDRIFRHPSFEAAKEAQITALSLLRDTDDPEFKALRSMPYRF